MKCPCGSQKAFVNCCQPIIEQQQFARLPVTLMKARYSAYQRLSDLPPGVLAQAGLPENAKALSEENQVSAQARQYLDFIYTTGAHQQRQQTDVASIAQWAASVQFVRLEVIDSQGDAIEANQAKKQQTAEQNEQDQPCGFVEFIAHYLEKNKWHRLHERSRFVVEQGHWRYLDGQHQSHPAVSVGRNDPCPCQSGKKFKQCHGRR